MCVKYETLGDFYAATVRMLVTFLVCSRIKLRKCKVMALTVVLCPAFKIPSGSGSDLEETVLN